jgi:hypothetical protein
LSIQEGVACRLFFVFFCYACCSFVITLYRANRQFDIRLLRREKTHQLPLAIPYRHLQTLLERAVASCLLRGCGVLTRAACRVRNDSGGIRAEKRGSRERFGSRKAR